MVSGQPLAAISKPIEPRLVFNHRLFQRCVKVFLVEDGDDAEPEDFLLLQIPVCQRGLDLEFVAHEPQDSRTIPIHFDAAAGNKLAEEFRIMVKEERDINVTMVIKTLEISKAFHDGNFEMRLADVG